MSAVLLLLLRCLLGVFFAANGLLPFTQPDSIVPSPGSSQSLNRYSYVLNNPLKYIDPTGHAEQGAIWNQPSWGVAGFYDQVGGIDRFPNAGGLLGFGAGRDWLGLGWEAGPGGWDAANDWTATLREGASGPGSGFGRRGRQR